jgi:GNAT superfamily N-acetyltransferase
MAPSTDFQIRPATPDDVAAIFHLVRKLAEYEKLSHMMVATETDFHEALFGCKPVVEGLVAVIGSDTIGYALYFSTFSTFLGRMGIYLEDIYVEPEHRGKGIGKALLKRLAQIAVERGCGRMEWTVLDWNQPSIEFYERLGAVRMPEWQLCRLTGEPLERLAQRS